MRRTAARVVDERVVVEPDEVDDHPVSEVARRAGALDRDHGVDGRAAGDCQRRRGSITRTPRFGR